MKDLALNPPHRSCGTACKSVSGGFGGNVRIASPNLLLYWISIAAAALRQLHRPKCPLALRQQTGN